MSRLYLATAALTRQRWEGRTQHNDIDVTSYLGIHQSEDEALGAAMKLWASVAPGYSVAAPVVRDITPVALLALAPLF